MLPGGFPQGGRVPSHVPDGSSHVGYLPPERAPNPAGDGRGAWQHRMTDRERPSRCAGPPRTPAPVVCRSRWGMNQHLPLLGSRAPRPGPAMRGNLVAPDRRLVSRCPTVGHHAATRRARVAPVVGRSVTFHVERAVETSCPPRSSRCRWSPRSLGASAGRSEGTPARFHVEQPRRAEHFGSDPRPRDLVTRVTSESGRSRGAASSASPTGRRDDEDYRPTGAAGRGGRVASGICAARARRSGPQAPCGPSSPHPGMCSRRVRGGSFSLGGPGSPA
jgi:hypothetical protein